VDGTAGEGVIGVGVGGKDGAVVGRGKEGMGVGGGVGGRGTCSFGFSGGIISILVGGGGGDGNGSGDDGLAGTTSWMVGRLVGGVANLGRDGAIGVGFDIGFISFWAICFLAKKFFIKRLTRHFKNQPASLSVVIFCKILMASSKAEKDDLSWACFRSAFNSSWCLCFS